MLVGIFGLLAWLVELYVILLIARALLSWFPAREGTALYGVVRVLDAITEPVLRPIRRIIPTAQVGGVGLDLSVLVLFLVIDVILLPLFR